MTTNMRIKELRTGNVVDYETIPYEVLRINIIDKESLCVKAVNHDWEVETCGINEVKEIDITPGFLKQNGFEPEKSLPHLWKKELPGYRYILYHDEIHYMEFDFLGNFSRVPWPVKEIHQMQNAMTDYGLDIELKV